MIGELMLLAVDLLLFGGGDDVFIVFRFFVYVCLNSFYMPIRIERGNFCKLDEAQLRIEQQQQEDVQQFLSKGNL